MNARSTIARRPWSAVLCVLLFAGTCASALSEEAAKASKPISVVLRQPLPPEELSLAENDAAFIITGPTFTYHVQKTTGAIGALRVMRDGQEVLKSTGPADVRIDQYRLASELNPFKPTLVSQGKNKIAIKVEGVLRDPEKRGPDVACLILHTFFNDGVVVSSVTLTPGADLPVKDAIVYQLAAQGAFSHYLHKRRDDEGASAVRGNLPEAGKAVHFSTLTSCLQVFSPTAALAVFTDGGAIHLSQPEMDTAVAEVAGRAGDMTKVALTQYVVHVAPGNKPHLLKAGEAFTFRTGICVAPNRLPHPRVHDLRMFTWIGDAKYPYPTDEEIARVAQLGFTLFQMHRAGTPGEPRPPAGEIDRVARKVHDSGMLFLWEENPDLLYASAPGVQKLKAEGTWALWQGFNYGGRYTAKMDPYCDLIATCLAAPNGQDEYRLANITRMMEQLPVDGLMLDDNLAYANCTLWKEHGHPRQVYDCLIELHEMNWRRRELMRSKCPHLVLVSHNTKAFVLPIVCDFDAQIYGEGYSFGTMEDYGRQFTAVAYSLHAQPMIWPGDTEPDRCTVSLAYNYDLLTGGGQYNQNDWRLFSKKLPYASGVLASEGVYAKTYNLAQYYFGLYESKPYWFVGSSAPFRPTTPQTYATVYRNQVWNDWLVPVANMNRDVQETSLEIRSLQALGIAPEKDYVVFDVQRRTAKTLTGDKLNEGFDSITVPGKNLRLYYLREQRTDALYHLWGGKRLAEVWDSPSKKLTLMVQGPAGARDEVLIGGAKLGIRQILVGGQPVSFAFDPAQGFAHGTVTFTTEALKIEAIGSPDGMNGLPEKPVAADPLATLLGK